MSVGVVVPAHDEELLLPGCLAALRVAADRAGVPVEVVVALDACTDGTAAVAHAAGVRTVTLAARNVGAARAAGFAALAGGPAWLATTDADSRVPPHWLRRQLEYAAAGADAVAGTVAVADWSGHPRRVRTAFGLAYRPLPGHGHVHGANLGLTAAAYRAVGPVAALAAGEDVDLVGRLVAAGFDVAWAADLPVLTSARRRPRAPGGFGDYLRALSRA